MNHVGRLMIAVLVAAAALHGADNKKERPRAKTPPAETATGCIDQRGETYVLAGDQRLRKLFTVHFVNTGDDNFARYLGHKVKVTGYIEGEDVFRVRHLDDLSEVCTPQGEEEK